MGYPFSRILFLVGNSIRHDIRMKHDAEPSSGSGGKRGGGCRIPLKRFCTSKLKKDDRQSGLSISCLLCCWPPPWQSLDPLLRQQAATWQVLLPAECEARQKSIVIAYLYFCKRTQRHAFYHNVKSLAYWMVRVIHACSLRADAFDIRKFGKYESINTRKG